MRRNTVRCGKAVIICLVALIILLGAHSGVSSESAAGHVTITAKPAWIESMPQLASIAWMESAPRLATMAVNASTASDSVASVKPAQLVPVMSSKSSEIAEEHTYEVTAFFLNVRTEPSSKSNIINVVKKGDRLQVIDVLSNGWMRLKTKGYVHGAYVAIADEGRPVVASAKQTKQPSLVATPSKAHAQAKQSKPSKPGSLVKADSGLTKLHIMRLLQGTDLAGHGLESVILEIEETYGINAYFTIAVMKLESGNGKSSMAKKRNNLFGMKSLSFKTKGDSVRKFGQLLAKSYVGKGFTTIEKVGAKYCPVNPKWSGKVKAIMKRDHNKMFV